jgi:hypothetical protein
MWVQYASDVDTYLYSRQVLLGELSRPFDNAQGYVCPSIGLCLVEACESWTRFLRLEMGDNLYSLLYLCVKSIS